jgi:metal-responsive CopG/Arc/MetJ family transcriptional regulator
MADDRITVRLDEDLRSELEAIAQGGNRSESDVVREALAEYCQSRGGGRSCYELARRLGMIGCVKKASRDLSTNRKHFEGFGRD